MEAGLTPSIGGKAADSSVTPATPDIFTRALNPQMYGVYQTTPFDMVLLQFLIDGVLPGS
jgi:hypothetical protein